MFNVNICRNSSPLFSQLERLRYQKQILVNSDVVVMEPVGSLAQGIEWVVGMLLTLGFKPRASRQEVKHPEPSGSRDAMPAALRCAKRLTAKALSTQTCRDTCRHVFISFASKIDQANYSPAEFALLVLCSIKNKIIKNINYLLGHAAIMRRNPHSVFFGLKIDCQSFSQAK